MEVVISLISVGILMVISADVISLALGNLKVVQLTSEKEIVKSYIRSLAFNSTTQASWTGFDPTKSYYLNGNSFNRVANTRDKANPIFTLQASQNVSQKGSWLAPFVSASMNAKTLSIFNDSFTFAKNKMRVEANDMKRVTGYILASRCVPLRTSRFKNGSSIDDDFPLTSAIYVLKSLTRKPFVSKPTNSAGYKINCCPDSSLGVCNDGNIKKYLVKIFVISLNGDSVPFNVEQVPEAADQGVINSGMMMTFDQKDSPSTFTSTFFSQENHCIRKGNKKDCPIVKISELTNSSNPQVVKFFSKFSEIIKTNVTEWSGQVMQPLSHTGVIELGF